MKIYCYFSGNEKCNSVQVIHWIILTLAETQIKTANRNHKMKHDDIMKNKIKALHKKASPLVARI